MGKEYAKVCLGLQLLLDSSGVPCIWFFEAGTALEEAVALEINSALDQCEGGVASVSVECSGALRDFPVIGESPVLFTPPPPTPKATAPLTPTQRLELEALRDGFPRQYTYHQINTARALVRRGLAEKTADKPMGEYWISITPLGAK